MKKKSLQQLALNKKKISNLASHSVSGGEQASSIPTSTVTVTTTTTSTTTVTVSLAVCTTTFPSEEQQR